VLRLSQAIALPFVLVTLGPWTLLLSWAVPVYFQISIVLILYCQVRLLQAWRRGRDGAAYILSGFLFLGFLGINDMLQEMRLIHTATIIAVGLLGFVLAQALALSRRFSRAFSAVEDLTIDLSHQNIALEEEVAERRRLEKEIVQVSEEERRRVSHDLHDGLCQLLTGARLRCSVLIRKHAKDAEGAPELAQLSALLEESVDQAYNLSRGLWPKEHEPKDVCTSLEGLACRSAQSAGITVDFCQQGTCAVCTNVHVTQLYHIAEEAIANALKHARATRIRVSLDCLPRHTVTLTVQDDGIGRAAAKPTKGGMGLRIMAHRARMLGGEFRLENAEGRGTLVICSVPCEGRPEETP
jgi:signal transduction histidine kinase